MCGIAGFFRHRDERLLRDMTERLRHRGPDSDGFFSDEDVGLGMRRLAVLDPAGGGQPIFDESRRLVVVYNGEIYNHRELRDELSAKGHRFATRTDTEVLVHLYEEEGAAMVRRLNGMFAFALWDGGRKRLLLARDPLGIKPLYYAETGGRLAFASEIKALRPFPGLPRTLSREALSAYLRSGSIPAPLSIFESIKKLPPAHRLVADRDGVRLERYWEPPRPEEGAAPPDPARIAELLDAAVRRQMVSDVPLGLFLSGGLDSGTLAALARRHADGPLKTFTIGYAPPDEGYNELDSARRLARHFDCDHRETLLTPNIRDLLTPLADAFDEPFADSSAVPTYLVSREARKHVTVALAGVGGDELFGGYPRYLGLLWARRLRGLPAPLRRLAARAAEGIPDRGGHVNWTGRAKRFLRGMDRPLAEQYARWTSVLSPDLLPEKWRAKGAGPAGPSTPSEIALRDLTTYLSDDLLCLGDRTSMAHGLEVRVPFLDLPLVEFLARVPLERKLAGGQLKALLKQIAGPLLPPGHLDQPKRGFSIPLARWLREDLRDVVDDALGRKSVAERGYLDPATVERLRRDHDRGAADNGDALWMLLTLELWHRRQSAP